MAERLLISRRDEGIPLPNKINKEIASVIKRALVHRQAPAHTQMMNTKSNAKGSIMAIPHQNLRAAMVLAYHEAINNASLTVDK